VRRAALAVADWPAAIALAEQHRLTAFLARHLVAHASSETPAAVLTALGQARLEISAKALADLAELGAVLADLRAAGIPALPFKGQLLSWSAYGDFTLRQSLDLDVAVHPGDLAAALDVLAARGYEHADGFSPVVGRELRRSLAQVTLLRLDGDGAWDSARPRRFASPDVPWDPPLAPMLARTHPAQIGGVALQQLAPADEILLQLLHGARHHWASIESLVAVRELLRRESIDGAALLRAARDRSEEHTSELQSLRHLVCRLLLEKKKKKYTRK